MFSSRKVPDHHMVHETDVIMAGSFTIAAFGPIDHGGVEGVRKALVTAMSVGPKARIGLVPDQSTRKWAYDPDRVLRAVREGPAITRAEYDGALVEMLATHDPSEAVSVSIRGDHVLVYIDHGIGDGQMTLNLSHLMSDAAAHEGVVPVWTGHTSEKHALAHSILRFYGSDPRRVRTLLAERSKAHVSGEITGPPPRSWSPSLVAVSTATSPEATFALKQWRKEHHPKTSISSLFFATLNAALIAQNIPLDYAVKVLFNVRRYLPPERRTLANLAAGIDLQLDDITDPREISRAIEGAVKSGRPIANLAVGSLKTKLGRMRSATTVVADAPNHPDTIRIALTDMAKHPQLNAIAYTDPAQAAYTAMVSPAGPGYITLAVGQLGDTFQVTASFHDNVIDSSTVRRALDAAVADPIAVLEAARPDEARPDEARPADVSAETAASS